MRKLLGLLLSAWSYVQPELALAPSSAAHQVHQGLSLAFEPRPYGLDYYLCFELPICRLVPAGLEFRWQEVRPYRGRCRAPARTS